MSYDESRAMVTHYARLGYARHVQTTCANAARALGNDPALSFWRAFGTIVEGGHSEAITKLEAMLGHADGDIELACMAAIVHAHKSARVVDEDSVERYETRVLSEEQGASATALVECATIYHLAGGSRRRARQGHSAAGVGPLARGRPREALLGWIEMTGRGDGDAGDGDLLGRGRGRLVRRFNLLGAVEGRRAAAPPPRCASSTRCSDRPTKAARLPLTRCSGKPGR